jgi:NMD protein affecting ribosome stability and mRNA decay
MDVLKLFPDTRIDRFGLAGSEVIKMTSREAAFALADYIQRKYGGYKTVSDENIRRDRSGKTISRKTISLRILSVEPGKYINLNGKPYIVEDVVDDRIVLRDRNGKKVIMSSSEIYKSWSKKK